MIEEGFLIHLASIYLERGCNSFGVMREGLLLFKLHYLRVISFAVKHSFVVFVEALFQSGNTVKFK